MAPDRVANIVEGIDGAARNESHVARAHVMSDALDLDIEAAFQKEKRLVLPMMNMRTRSDARLDDVFEDRHGYRRYHARRAGFTT